MSILLPEILRFTPTPQLSIYVEIRTDGGFIQGIQTQQLDGSNDWFFGSLQGSSWAVSKGDFQNPKLTVLSNGNTGIGTNPTDKLHVYTNDQQGEVRIGGGNGNGNGRIYIQANFANNSSYIDAYGDNVFKKLAIEASPLILNGGSNGYVGVGTTSPFAKFQVKAATDNNFYVTSSSSFTTVGAATDAGASSELRIAGFPLTISGNGGAGLEHMRVTSEGNVGIGTNNPQGYRLAVAGNVIAESVKVAVQGNWPDYVFKPGNKLISLEEVESFVQKNKHLPEMPSESEVKKEGIDLGQMDARLLKKIEELTLYMIEQNKRSAEQDKIIQEQDERIEELEKQLKK